MEMYIVTSHLRDASHSISSTFFFNTPYSSDILCTTRKVSYTLLDPHVLYFDKHGIRVNLDEWHIYVLV